MHAVAAGMHHRHLLAVEIHLPHARRIGQAGLLEHRQRIHVGADHQRRPREIAQQRHHAGLADAAMHLEALRLQLGGQPRGRLHFLQRQFGIRVQVLEQRIQMRIVRGDRLPEGRVGGVGRARRNKQPSGNQNRSQRHARLQLGSTTPVMITVAAAGQLTRARLPPLGRPISIRVIPS